LDSHQAILKGVIKPQGNTQISAKRREGRIAQWLLAKSMQFPFLFYEALRFYLHLLNVEGAVENFKNTPRFFSYFCSTFSQTQTVATVSLNI
jgi:hypothetical protein